VSGLEIFLIMLAGVFAYIAGRGFAGWCINRWTGGGE